MFKQLFEKLTLLDPMKIAIKQAHNLKMSRKVTKKCAIFFISHIKNEISTTLNLFHATGLFLFPLKTSVNSLFSQRKHYENGSFLMFEGVYKKKWHEIG